MPHVNTFSLIVGVVVIIVACSNTIRVFELMSWLNDTSIHHKKKIRREYQSLIPISAILSLGWFMWGALVLYTCFRGGMFGPLYTIIICAIYIYFGKDKQAEASERYFALRKDFFRKAAPPQENIPDKP